MAQDQIRGILVILVHLGENQEKKRTVFPFRKQRNEQFAKKVNFAYSSFLSLGAPDRSNPRNSFVARLAI